MIELTIISNLVLNEEYTRKVIPFIKEEYFKELPYKVIFRLTHDYFGKYNTLPSKEALQVELDNSIGINDSEAKEIKGVIKSLIIDEKSLEWLISTTEVYCKKRAMFNVIVDGMAIIDGQDKKRTEDAIPGMAQEALGICFNPHVGYDYFIDAEKRWDLLHNKEVKIPFDIEKLNEITDGGVPKKTLNIIVGGINVGKTLVMCHMAGYNLLCGKNVLYVTMEMGWQMIQQRIDLHLLNMSFQDYKMSQKVIYLKKIADLKRNVTGRLIVKDYPTATVSSAHFRHLLHELNQKENFVPDVVYIDYINLCLSARLKYSAGVNGTYMPVKMIAEELRGLASEFDFACWSGTQLTRSGFTNSDPVMEDTAESFGLPATADFMGVIVQPSELEQLGQYMFIQWKNRYMSKLVNKRFIIGVDLDKQKLFNAEQSATEALMDDSKPSLGEEPKFNIGKFQDFK